jgi:hypothetical protein
VGRSSPAPIEALAIMQLAVGAPVPVPAAPAVVEGARA